MSVADWDNLPDIVLTNVFKHIKHLQDRYSASQVSKTWSRAFRSPEIWHKKMELKCWIYSNMMIPIKFVQSFGEYLKELKIDCCFGNKLESCDDFFRFFTISTEKKMNLEKFTLTNLDLTSIYDDGDEDLKRNILGVIRDFLATQTILVHLDLECCRAPLKMGLDLLNKLANPGGIRNLCLEDFFEWDWDCNVLTFPNYHDVIGSFKSLVRLTINYNYIDSNVLKLIVENCSRSLEVIEIICSAETDENRVIPKETWAWVKKECPQLKVDVKFHIYSLDSDYCHVIPTEMGLHSFIVEGCRGDIIDLEPLLIQLCQFRETLEMVELGFKTKGTFEDRHLIELVSSCRGLKRFKDFFGLWSIETVKKISELQLKGTIDLSYCYFNIRYQCRKEDDVLIKEIHRLNELIKVRQGVQFKLHVASYLNH